MTTFPSIEPDRRTLEYGDYPQNTHVGLSGGDVRFLLNNKRVEQILRLSYRFLTETQAQSLLTHFNGQNGTIESFDLASIIWSGYSTPPVSSSNYKWRYSEPFKINISAPSLYSADIVLVSVPV